MLQINFYVALTVESEVSLEISPTFQTGFIKNLNWVADTVIYRSFQVHSLLFKSVNTGHLSLSFLNEAHPKRYPHYN